MSNIADLRIDYNLDQLTREQLRPDPFEQFNLWFEQARQARMENEPNAMTLATATKDGIPSARTVLLKGVDKRGFVFYTNYTSQKGQELTENPHAALLFYWGALHCQIRITGTVARLTAEESLAYYHSRPRESQLGAWASPQSQVLAHRAELEARHTEITAKFADQPIPLPPFWGGYRLSPICFEFWQGRSSRLHDRFRYRPESEGTWLIERLAP